MNSSMNLMCAAWFGAVGEAATNATSTALGRVHQRAVEHHLGGLLVGQLVDEHVARIRGGIGVEGGDDDTRVTRFLQHRRHGVEVDRGQDDGVRLLGEEVLDASRPGASRRHGRRRHRRTRRRAPRPRRGRPSAAASK